MFWQTQGVYDTLITGGHLLTMAGEGALMRNVDPQDGPLATLVALMEGVANGTTTFADYTGRWAS